MIFVKNIAKKDRLPRGYLMSKQQAENLQQHIMDKLQQKFSPTFIDVINESHQHNVAPGAESHFKVIIVTERFAEQRMIARHRAIYALLAEELAGSVHALALHTYTPQEWHELQDTKLSSPACRGGGKH